MKEVYTVCGTCRDDYHFQFRLKLISVFRIMNVYRTLFLAEVYQI